MVTDQNIPKDVESDTSHSNDLVTKADFSALYLYMGETFATKADLRALQASIENNFATKADFGSLKNEVGSIKGEVGFLKREVISLKTNLNSLKDELGDFRESVYALFDKQSQDYKRYMDVLMEDNRSQTRMIIESMNMRTEKSERRFSDHESRISVLEKQHNTVRLSA